MSIQDWEGVGIIVGVVLFLAAFLAPLVTGGDDVPAERPERTAVDIGYVAPS